MMNLQMTAVRDLNLLGSIKWKGQADVLGRIVDHKVTKLDELMPWHYAQA